MSLKLSKENWWSEIGAADVSGETKSNLRSAMSSYWYKVEGLTALTPRVLESDLRRIREEIGALIVEGELVNIDGDPMEKRDENAPDSFRIRLTKAVK